MPRPRTARAVVFNGQRYRSGFEAGIARDLAERGIEGHYEEERLLYTSPHVYVVDFAPRGVLIEAKGWFTPADRTKMLAVKEAHPDADVRLLFQANHTFGKRKTTCGQWCDRHGITWAVGDTIPEAWLKE